MLAESGVLQGDTLAAVLFVWIIDEIMREWERRKNPKWGIKIVFRKGKIAKEFFPHDWEHLSDIEVCRLLVNWLAFADDVAFVSHSMEEIISAFCLFRDICKTVGLEINFSKCGLMSMIWNGMFSHKVVKVDGEEIPVVSRYTYLGVQIVNTGDFEEHVEERSAKALGTVAGRIKNARSWIGKDTSLLLDQLNVCFAPCLAWGTNVITLKNRDVAVLNVAFYRFLRTVYRVRYSEQDKKFEKSNKELLQVSGLSSPSELLPLARLKFFFHLLLSDTVIPPECFLNGKIEDEGGNILAQDKRSSTYAQDLSKDLQKFRLIEIHSSILSNIIFQKNIYNECAQLGDSFFASVAAKGIFVSESKKTFPSLHPNTNFVFGTDGSLSQKRRNLPPTGGFAIVDAHGNFFSTSHECNEETSSTTLELLALQKTFLLLKEARAENCVVFLLVDSLSAIRLTLGLDIRNEDRQILREIDEARTFLYKLNFQDVFIHVRSHRNVPVKLNSQADRLAGAFSHSAFVEKVKCQPECPALKKCEACQWNSTVNAFLSTINPASKNIFITR
jgi:ribonuclease HI